MHGLIFLELKKFVESKFGAAGWDQLLEKARLPKKKYLSIQEYPDSEIEALVNAASAITGTPPQALLESFGEFIVPTLLRIYGHLAKPEWRTLEFIENTERAIHEAVRINDPGAKPPRLQVTRTGANEITLHYDSPRKMCGVAKGIARGVARHYKESISFRDHKCMLRGDPACEISMQVEAGAAAARS